MKDTHLSPTFAFQSYILVGILTRCDQFILTPVSVISETTRLWPTNLDSKKPLQNAMQKNSIGDNDKQTKWFEMHWYTNKKPICIF